MDKFCYIKNNSLQIEYKYFKLLNAEKESNHDAIIAHISSQIDVLLESRPQVKVNIDMSLFNLIHLDKYYEFIKKTVNYFSVNYVDKLDKCYLWHSPMMLNGLIKMLSKFLDKDTIGKIVLHQEIYP